MIEDGTVKVLGSNVKGELGLGSASGSISIPTSVPGLTEINRIYAGYTSSFALKSKK